MKNNLKNEQENLTSDIIIIFRPFMTTQKVKLNNKKVLLQFNSVSFGSIRILGLLKPNLI